MRLCHLCNQMLNMREKGESALAGNGTLSKTKCTFLSLASFSFSLLLLGQLKYEIMRFQIHEVIQSPTKRKKQT